MLDQPLFSFSPYHLDSKLYNHTWPVSPACIDITERENEPVPQFHIDFHPELVAIVRLLVSPVYHDL